MTYTKTNWVDQAGQVKYTKSEDGGYWILTPNYEDVSPIGTPVNADNLNHIENGISDCDTAITDLREDLTDLQEEVTAIYPKIDGQWVASNITVVSGLNIHASSDVNTPVDLSAYLPNDGYTYEILLDGTLNSSDTSGQYAALFVFGSKQAFHICAVRPRTNAYVTTAGNGVITVGSDRKFYVARRPNYYGSATITLDAYRRVGTNE